MGEKSRPIDMKVSTTRTLTMKLCEINHADA